MAAAVGSPVIILLHTRHCGTVLATLLATAPASSLLAGGGTPHKPPYLDSRSYVIHEATSCAHFLLQVGVARVMPGEPIARGHCSGGAAS